MCAAAVTYEDVVTALAKALVQEESTLRVRGPAAGYRCKATYSLYPRFSTSPLATDAVNDACAAVHEFVAAHSRLAKILPKFYFEVLAKVTRGGDVLIKISFWNEACPLSPEVLAALGVEGESPDSKSDTATGEKDSRSTTSLFDVWVRSPEKDALVRSCLARVPRLVALVAHVRLLSEKDSDRGKSSPAAGKPDKHCAYVPLLPSGALTVTERTPNGHPFVLSADSFCEVNHPMEDAIYETVMQFLRLPAAAPRTAPRAFISGRDVNGVWKTFAPYFSHTTVATTCPLVFADAQANGIPNCTLTPKCELAARLREALAGGAAAEPERQVLLTAGRHGLHPSVSVELARLARRRRLTDLIYVSCNVVSMARDLHVLKTGLRVEDARTFDFFPGTDYVMTVLHLVPLPLLPAGGRVLLTPVGPPGVGKSTCGRALQDFFNQQRDRQTTENGNAGGGAAAAAALQSSSVSRAFLSVPSAVRAVHVERDAVFAACKSRGCGLKQAKRETHEALLSSLAPTADGRAGEGEEDEEPRAALGAAELPTDRRTVVYLDSTNSSREARALYAAAAFGNETDDGNDASARAAARAWYTWRFDYGGGVETLLARVATRGADHPSFPSTEVSQRDKVQTICAALSREEATEAEGGRQAGRENIYILDSRPGRSVDDTTREAVVAACAALLMAPPLALLCTRPATQLLLAASAA